MYKRILSAALLTAAVLSACSERGSDTVPASEPGTAGVVLQSDCTRDVTVYAFRQSKDGEFVYESLFRDGWSDDGRMSVRLRNGRYRFLFSAGENDGFEITEPTSSGVTRWEDVAFSVVERADEPGVYDGAGELFLQYPEADANRIYDVGGTDMTVSARLTRAVGMIGVALKRGYRSGDVYVEVPYDGTRNILDEISGIEIKVLNAGKTAGPEGVSGTIPVTGHLDMAGKGTVSPEGFTSLDGPFVLPPADGAEAELEITVIPAEGSPVGNSVIKLKGNIERNKRLDVTLWVVSGFPEVGVEIDTAPIVTEKDGDAGIWE